jgi:hypothetical protein
MNKRTANGLKEQILNELGCGPAPNKFLVEAVELAIWRTAEALEAKI